MDIVEFNFDLLGKAMVDPYPTYDAMRQAGRVLKTPLGAILLHRYDDVRQVQSDPDGFSAGALTGGGMAELFPEAVTGDGAGEGSEFLLAQTMLTSDPPDHERLRRVVNRAFTPRSIAALEDRVRQITRDLLAPLAKGEPFDIVADFAGPLPTIVISELLGIPSEDGDQFRRWSEGATGTDVRNRLSAETSRRYGMELRKYLSEQIARRHTEPTDDLIGRMVEANHDDVMTHAEVVASCMLLLIAGNETTMRLITNMTLALSRHPDQHDRLLAQPELIPSGIEETLRYDSPVQVLLRLTKQDVEVGGAEIPAKRFIIAALGAANRDPQAFADPDVYDVGRSENMHVSFGHGIHYCLGAPLARRETKVAFEELLEMAPHFKVLTPDEDLEYPPGAMLRSPRTLVVQA